MGSTPTERSSSVVSAAGIPDPDVELAKADLVARIHRLLENRQMSPQEAAALLNVTALELPALLQGRLATCSLDQVLRLLTWLGDSVDTLIRSRVKRTSRGVVRVFQTTGVYRADRFELGSQTSNSLASAAPACRPPGDDGASIEAPKPKNRTDNRLLLDKWRLEEMTSLDITTIYRKMKVGSFPQPVRVGRRRVAWRASEIMRWQQELQVGTEAAAWMPAKPAAPGPRRGGRGRGG